jgi:hypothetical protein
LTQLPGPAKHRDYVNHWTEFFCHLHQRSTLIYFTVQHLQWFLTKTICNLFFSAQNHITTQRTYTTYSYIYDVLSNFCYFLASACMAYVILEWTECCQSQLGKNLQKYQNNNPKPVPSLKNYIQYHTISPCTLISVQIILIEAKVQMTDSWIQAHTPMSLLTWIYHPIPHSWKFWHLWNICHKTI